MTPRAASGPASAATSAAERASWMPPAKTRLTSSAGMPRSMASPTTADGLLPEHEARPRADVPAALAPLEHEAAAAVAQILLEQARRGDVQVTCAIPSRSSPAAWSGRPPAIRANGGRTSRDGRELLGAELGRDEAEDAHAPRPSGELGGRLVAAERGPPARAAAPGPGTASPPSRATASANAGDVADPRHRALEDRVARAVADGQRRAFGQRPGRARRRDSLGDRPLDGLDDPADRHELAGQPRRQRGVLADRQALPVRPADLRRDGRFPGRASRLGGLPQPGQRAASRASRRPALPAPTPGIDDRRLAAVPPRDPLAPFRRRAATRGPATAHRPERRRPRPPPRTPRRPLADPAADPDRQLPFRQRRLQQDERAIRSAPAPGLMAGDDQPVAPDATARRTSAARRRLRQHEPPRVAGHPDRRLESRFVLSSGLDRNPQDLQANCARASFPSLPVHLEPACGFHTIRLPAVPGRPAPALASCMPKP